jgi:hypothetical protein
MANIYYDPDKFGLTPVGEIDWSSGSYEFDYTVVWKRDLDGRFVYAEDSGCSCPVPFESTGVDDLTVLPKRGGLKEFREHCADRQAEMSETRGEGWDRQTETVALIEKMHGAGAR